MFLVLFSSFWTHSNCGFSWKPHESLFGLGVRLWLRWTRWSHSSESLRDFTGAKGQSTPFFWGGGWDGHPSFNRESLQPVYKPSLRLDGWQRAHVDWWLIPVKKTSKSLTIWPPSDHNNSQPLHSSEACRRTRRVFSFTLWFFKWTKLVSRPNNLRAANEEVLKKWFMSSSATWQRGNLGLRASQTNINAQLSALSNPNSSLSGKRPRAWAPLICASCFWL